MKEQQIANRTFDRRRELHNKVAKRIESKSLEQKIFTECKLQHKGTK